MIWYNDNDIFLYLIPNISVDNYIIYLDLFEKWWNFLVTETTRILYSTLISGDIQGRELRGKRVGMEFQQLTPWHESSLVTDACITHVYKDIWLLVYLRTMIKPCIIVNVPSEQIRVNRRHLWAIYVSPAAITLEVWFSGFQAMMLAESMTKIPGMHRAVWPLNKCYTSYCRICGLRRCLGHGWGINQHNFPGLIMCLAFTFYLHLKWM